MISSCTLTRNLLTKIAFFTTKSRRQTTPNLIKNPTLSQRGIIVPSNKSYAYNLPETLPNRHLYWNNNLQNKLRRKEYNHHRLYKLGIKSIHDETGTPLHNRSVEEVLYELSSLKLLKESFGRTLINLREIALTYPQILKTSDKDIVDWALNQVDTRNLPTMTPYEFSTYCYLRQMLKSKPTTNMLVHMYKWIESEVQVPSDRFKTVYFLNNIRYIFRQSYPVEYNDILYTKQIEFKLFEDIEPKNKPLEEMLPKLFTDAQIKELKNSQFKLANYTFLLKIPGGKGLYDRLEKA